MKRNLFIHSGVYYNEKINKILFRASITKKSIYQLEDILDYINHKNINNKKIDLHITSNGGDCHSGLFGYDLLKLSKFPIHTYCDGYIASSASMLFLGGKQRFITKNSFILIHQLSIDNFAGKHCEIGDLYYNTNIMMQKIKNIYKKETKILDEELEFLLKRDLLLDSKFCLEKGFVNKIL